MAHDQHAEPIDVNEHGAPRNGAPQLANTRLFVQLLVFTGCREHTALRQLLTDHGVTGALYRDLHDPMGVGLVTMHENPAFFVTTLRLLLQDASVASMALKPSLTMFGRTYASGYEPDLRDWLLERPKRTICNPEWPWAVWYPLRRSGAFAALPPEEQSAILREHGRIGRAYGDANLAHDVRLACHGLDYADNEFVIGLVGEQLHPLSHIVQTMRRTRQTSEYITQMGPFFVGHAVWQSA